MMIGVGSRNFVIAQSPIVDLNAPSYFCGMRSFVVLTLSALLTSCGSNDTGTTEEQVTADSSTIVPGNVIDLASFDVPFTVELGDITTLRVDTPEVHWNEEFGHLEVNAGEHFGLTITEEPADLARLKADLDRDMLREHTVMEETPAKLVYRSQFPDKDLVFIHFYQLLHVGDRTFVIEDRVEGRFNEADIARMVMAVHPKQPA